VAPPGEQAPRPHQAGGARKATGQPEAGAGQHKGRAARRQHSPPVIKRRGQTHTAEFVAGSGRCGRRPRQVLAGMTTASAPPSLRFSGSGGRIGLGPQRGMARSLTTGVSCSTATSPGRRSGHCKGQRSANGAQKLLSV